MPEPLTDEDIGWIERHCFDTEDDTPPYTVHRLIATIRQRTQERDEAMALASRAADVAQTANAALALVSRSADREAGAARRLRELLAKIQWSGPSATCPVCIGDWPADVEKRPDGEQYREHRPGCALRAALSGTAE
jgi:hypothetical protein